MRRNQRAIATLAMLLAAAVPGGGAAADTPGASAPQTWIPQGKAVSGSAVSSTAPHIAAPGTYQDTIGVGKTKIYAVTLDDTSAAYLSAFAIPRQDSKVGFLDGITLKLVAADGMQCDQYDARFRADNAADPIGGYVQRQPAIGPECQQAGDYFLYVRRNSAAGGSTSDWALEIRFMVEPGVKNETSLGPVPSYPSDTPTPNMAQAVSVQGAPSIDGAVAVPATGACLGQLAPGQSIFYRVPLDWGQQLHVTAEFSNAVITQAGGFSASGARLDLYNTARGLVDDADAAYDGEPASVAVATAPVAYVNRESSDPRAKASPFAGWYYIQVTLHQDVAKYTTGKVDVTLRLDTTGNARSGPAYLADPTEAGFGVLSGAGGTLQPVMTLRMAGYGALGLGTVLLVWLAVWSLRARRFR